MTETPCLRKAMVYEQKFIDSGIRVICVSSAGSAANCGAAKLFDVL